MSRDGRKTGGGSRKGRPNKVTQALREMILSALDRAGGENYLLAQSAENPTAFLSLLGRIIPLQVDGTIDHKHVVRLPERDKTIEAWDEAVQQQPPQLQ